MIESMDAQMVREALQSRLLVELMSQSLRGELVLKGGMAMRAVHGSVRMTKDLDFDADSANSKDHVQALVRRALNVVAKSGLIDDMAVSEPKQTPTTLRWKILGKQPGGNALMHLTVEISRRPPMAMGHAIDVELRPEFGGGPGARVRVLDSTAIAVTKVLALTSENRQAPRDMFDLYVLITAGNVPSPARILSVVPEAATRLPKALAELWQKLDGFTFEQFRTEVLPFLPDARAAEMTEAIFEEMRAKVGVEVEQWLRDAIGMVEKPPVETGDQLTQDAPVDPAARQEP